MQIETPDYRRGEWQLPAVDVSAARDAQGKIHIALVNLDPNRGASVAMTIAGSSASSASGKVLTAATMDARNTFERPNAIQPAAFKATRKGDALRCDIPPKSVVVVTVN